MQNAELVEIIWQAFRYTSIDKIYVGDEESESKEYADAAKFFKAHSREELAHDPNLIPIRWANWDMISAAAWHHFLPAYLIASLNAKGVEAMESVLLALSPSGSLPEVFLDRVTQITLTQRTVISTWFDAISTMHSVEFADDPNFKASSEFWHDEMAIRTSVESFKPDPDSWRTKNGSYSWLEPTQMQSQSQTM